MVEPRFTLVWLYVICYLLDPNKYKILCVGLRYFEHLPFQAFVCICTCSFLMTVSSLKGENMAFLLFSSVSSSLLSLRKTLSHRSWQMGSAWVMLLFGPEIKSQCSQTCFCLLLFQKVQPSCCLLAAFPPPTNTSASPRQSAWWNTTQPISVTTPASLLTQDSKWVLAWGRISGVPLHRPGRGCWQWTFLVGHPALDLCLSAGEPERPSMWPRGGWVVMTCLMD